MAQEDGHSISRRLHKEWSHQRFFGFVGNFDGSEGMGNLVISSKIFLRNENWVVAGFFREVVADHLLEGWMRSELSLIHKYEVTIFQDIFIETLCKLAVADFFPFYRIDKCAGCPID